MGQSPVSKLIWGASLFSVTLLAALFLTQQQSRNINRTTVWVNHTQDVILRIQRVVTATLENQTAARGYVLTTNENYIKQVSASGVKLIAEVASLRTLVQENPEQIRLLDSLAVYAKFRVAFSDSMVRTRKEKGLTAAADLVLTGRGLFIVERIKQLSTDMESLEQQLLARHKQDSEDSLRNVRVTFYLLLGAFLLLGVFFILQMVRGIREQRSNEQKFISLLDAAPDATVIVDHQGAIQMVNLQTERIFGYSRKELIGQKVEMLMPQMLHEVHQKNRDQYMAHARVREMGAGLELFALRKGGDVFPVEISLSPITTATGMLVTASVRDITERKAVEEKLRKANEEMEAFSYSVSHDLRAPLRGISGFTTILEEDYASKLDDEARRITSVIRSNTEKMGQLIDDLLHFSRVGRKDMIKTPTDMNVLVREVMMEVERMYPSLKVAWSAGALPVVMADLNLIRQVWVNLLQNAVKYSSAVKDPAISIRAIEKDGAVEFSVCDNGIGFDNKYVHKLFKVFQRLHSDETYEGTGLGLALVEKIVSRHGGTVRAEGTPGAGACFSFTLPRAH